MLIRLLLVVLMLHFTQGEILERNLTTCVIGGLFDRDAFMRKAFSVAINTMNYCAYKSDICEKLHKNEDGIDIVDFHRMQFSAVIVESENDIYHIYRNLARVAGINIEELGLEQDEIATMRNLLGLVGIIGPHNKLTSPYVGGILERHDLPSIVIRPELEHDRLETINLYPDLGTLATVYMKMVQKLNWTSFSIIYEKSENLLYLEQLLKMYGPYEHPVYAFKLGGGPNYSEPLLLAKKKEHKNFIIDCSYESLKEILAQTQEVGMMTESYRYIVTNLDLQTIDLHPYQHSGVNISGLRMFDPSEEFVKEIVADNLEDFGIESIEKLRTEEALMFDAVALFAQSYKDLTYGYRIPGKNWSEMSKKKKFIEDVPDPWRHGLSLRNYILFNTISGLTGPVMLDSDGVRRRFKLDILNLHQTGLTKVGMWNPDDGFDDLRLMNELKMKHFRILITMNEPYAMRVNYSKSLEGNERYEGFVIDIIKELSKEIGFNYTFFVYEGSSYGACKKSPSEVCSCDGMMEKILNREMDMAITDLTITEEREKCVDFSTAFWNLGMSILYKKPMKAPPTLFSFLSPFHSHVWIYLVATWIVVSVLFFIVGRTSPFEWTNVYPCIEEPTELENQFTISNSFWFTIGAIMQQGSEIAPRSPSTRLLAGCWWFFCLIIVSSYTANLAAFLTIESPIRVVRGIEDLYNQTKIKFGAKKGGSTFMYFQSSRDKKHKQLAEMMSSKEWERYMVDTNDQGVHLAETEDYAFIMESSTIEYVQYRKCDLEQTGPYIDQKSYAIAYAENFEYHQEISRTISYLQEKLIIRNLYDKWWKEKGAVCFQKESANTAEAMNLDQLEGVFVVLGIGIAISCLLTTVEFVRGIKSISKKEEVSFMETMSVEMKSITRSKSVKPVLKKQTSTESNLSDDYSYNFTMTTQG